MRPLIDGHLDLAWNALAYDRDQTMTVDELRTREQGLDEPGRSMPTVSLPQLREAGVRLFMGTLFARSRADRQPAPRVRRAEADFASASIAHAVAAGQLAYYRLLERQGLLRLVTDRRGLDELWYDDDDGDAHRPPPPVGCVMMIEGADPIVEPDDIGWWWRQGVRIVSLAHVAATAYAVGNGGEGPVTDAGRAMLRRMDQLGAILDTSHLCERSFFGALDAFGGRVIASHTNCRALADGPRQFSDEQLRRLIARDAVVGVVMHIGMLANDAPRQQVSLDTVADHIDHLCDLAGSARHVAIGSDLDGGFGVDQCPRDLDTVIGLRRVGDVLRGRGHDDQTIDAIFHGNWLRLLREALPVEAPADADQAS